MAERASRSIVAALTASANSGEGYSRRVSLREDLLGAAAADLGVARDIRIAAHEVEVEKAATAWQTRRDSTAPERYYRLADAERVLRATPTEEIRREAMAMTAKTADADRCDLLAARLLADGESLSQATAMKLREDMVTWETRQPWRRTNPDLEAIAELRSARTYGMLDVPLPSALDSDPPEPGIYMPSQPPVPAPAARSRK